MSGDILNREADRKMNEFKNYHPVVNMFYFAAVIAFSVVFMHPVFILISLFSGLVYSAVLGGRKMLKFDLTCLLPLAVTAALANPAFNHEGITIIAYFPNGNPLTLESVIYGLAAAGMLSGVICWFSCFGKVMTSDKFIYLFGKIVPSLSLVLSMALAFVPKLLENVRQAREAQKCIGINASQKGVVRKLKNGIKLLSVVITRSMENAIDASDSMKSRGYGLPGRSAFSNFNFTKRDALAVVCTAAFAVYIIVGGVHGGFYFRYFPSMRETEFSPLFAGMAAVYAVLCLMPMMIGVWEELKWKKLKSKI